VIKSLLPSFISDLAITLSFLPFFSPFDIYINPSPLVEQINTLLSSFTCSLLSSSSSSSITLTRTYADFWSSNYFFHF